MVELERIVRCFALIAIVWGATPPPSDAEAPRVQIEQLTFGSTKHHFFGYIGHAGTIPWNASGRYIVALQTEFQDHMPRPDEAAEIVLIDTQAGNSLRVVDRTRAWNFQQGTMLYWNPEHPETQFFFNDRDPATNQIFCVLFDIAAGQGGARVAEFRDPRYPVGNSGVARKGKAFLALNYGRLHRLRESYRLSRGRSTGQSATPTRTMTACFASMLNRAERGYWSRTGGWPRPSCVRIPRSRTRPCSSITPSGTGTTTGSSSTCCGDFPRTGRSGSTCCSPSIPRAGP